MLNPFTGQEQEILLAIEPVTMAIVGSAIFGAISNWIGGNKQANTSQEIERERIAAAEREAEKQREFEREQTEQYRANFERAKQQDIAMRQPLIDSVDVLGPGINSMLGAGGGPTNTVGGGRGF